MPNAARVTFKTTNLTQRTTTPLQGVSFVLGQTLRGPYDDPKVIINSWSQFQRIHGGIPNTPDREFVIQSKKILEAGGKLRVCRVVNHNTLPEKPGMIDLLIGSFDIDFTTGDSIDVEVDTIVIGTVDFDTDQATTLQAIADMLLTHQNISSVTLSSTNTRGLFISRTKSDVTISFSGTVAVWSTTTNSGITTVDNETAFQLAMKYGGIDYTNILTEIIPSTNGDSESFGIKITHATDSSISETYNNLKIVKGLAADSHFLDVINYNSEIFEVVYVNTTALSSIEMLTGIKYGYMSSQTSDVVPVVADFIGDSSGGTGLHAFDDYSDALQIAVPGKSNSMVGLHEAGADYANNRKDLVYFAHLSNTYINKDQYITGRGTSINTKFCAIYGGGVKLTDPITSLPVNYSELADVIIAANKSDEEKSPYYSFAGPNRGLISGILGIVNNYGSNAKYPDLNELANHQINMAINRDGKSMIWGNFTSQIDDNQEKYLHIVRGMITMIKTLRPTLETFLEEPCAPPTWNRMYYTVKPFLDSLLGEFFHTYEWVGDQFATGVTDSDLQVNTAADVADGKYKVKLIVTLIASMQEIEVEIISTVAGVQINF